VRAHRPGPEERPLPRATPQATWRCCTRSTRPLPRAISPSLPTTSPAISVAPSGTGWPLTRVSSTPSSHPAPPGSTSSRAGGASSGAKPSPGSRSPTPTTSPMLPESPPPSSTAMPNPGSGDAHRPRTARFVAVSSIAFEEQRNDPVLSRWEERVVGIHQCTEVGQASGQVRQGREMQPGQQEGGTDKGLEQQP
jgi:hypothetical protein